VDLRNVGFAPDKDLLLVLSTQGEGIFDCTNGEIVARLNNNSDWWQDFDELTSCTLGFDLLDKVKISTSGLYGGDHLPKTSIDNWILIESKPEPDDKPFDMYMVKKIFLVSPDKKEKVFITKDGPCELRAFGFSETGKSFVVALSCNLIIYSRK
jgi:hypothetical protein